MSTKKKAQATAETKATATAPAASDPDTPDRPDTPVTPVVPVEGASKSPAKKADPIYELADKDTGFYDHVTGYKIVRDQRIALKGNAGEATKIAIASGRLVLVS